MAGLGLFWLLGNALRRLRLHNPRQSLVEPSPPQFKPEPARKGHEKRDANVKWIFGLLLFLLVSVLAIHFILAWWFQGLKHSPAPAGRWQPTARNAGVVPASRIFPRLQISAPLDLKAFRQREEAELTTSGWINWTSGIVRIPIEQAMELVLQEGLPVRGQSNQSQLGPSSYQLLQQRLEHRQSEIYRDVK
jgi:hypothetical protein